MSVISKPSISKTLQVWSGHITLGDNNLISEYNGDSFAGYDMGMYYRLFITEHVSVKELLSLGFSINFVNIVKEALRLDCEYIDIDPDVEAYENLPTFDW
jgi:hypothetical protein